MLGIILAAGNGNRYGEGDKNLHFIEHNISLLSECEKIIIIVNKDNRKNYEKYSNSNIIIKTQNPAIYGPAAALKSISDELVNESFIVLLGDNYISKLPSKRYFMKMYGFLSGDVSVASFVKRECSEDNLRLAYINKNDLTIKEKPHDYKEGLYYAGYMAFGDKVWKNLKNLKPSSRNEYELTDLYNSCSKRHLEKAPDDWRDITYKTDLYDGYSKLS